MVSMAPELPGVVAVVTALIACATDLRTRRIPNAITVSSTLAAVAVQTVSGGIPGASHALGGALAGAALFFPFFALRGLGAGDVKLLAALGAWLGPVEVLWVGLYAMIAGGAIGLAVALGHGYLRTALTNIGAMTALWRTTGVRPIEGMTLADSTAPRLAYAVPVLIGLGLRLWIR
jgi:prepilin peptidase CpaA